MSIERARRHLDQFGWGDRIIETQASSATVAEAAQAVGTEPARIAKTLSFDLGDGVCPFGVQPGVRVFLDVSLRRFATVFPAAGSGNSAIELTVPELETASGVEGWVEVTRTRA